MGKPGLSALAIYSYATYNPKPFTLKDVLIKKYYEMDCAAVLSQNYCNIDQQHVNMQQALSLVYAGKNHTGSKNIMQGILFSALGKSNNGESYFPTIVDAAISKKNSIRALINQDVLLTDQFDQALKDSTIIEYGDYAPYPVFAFSLDYDSMVSPLNTHNLLKHNVTGNLHSYILDNEKFKTCTPGWPVRADHLGAYLVSHVFVLKFFEDVVNRLKPTATEEL
jgi:hypothetical protein